MQCSNADAERSRVVFLDSVQTLRETGVRHPITTQVVIATLVGAEPSTLWQQRVTSSRGDDAFHTPPLEAVASSSEC
jgi:hypothetical protein